MVYPKIKKDLQDSLEGPLVRWKKIIFTEMKLLFEFFIPIVLFFSLFRILAARLI